MKIDLPENCCHVVVSPMKINLLENLKIEIYEFPGLRYTQSTPSIQECANVRSSALSLSYCELLRVLAGCFSFLCSSGF